MGLPKEVSLGALYNRGIGEDEIMDQPVVKNNQEEANLSAVIRHLISLYQQESRRKLTSKPEATVKASQALSGLALIYEKIRNAVDFRGEHLFRRNAIERIMRRKLVGNGSALSMAQSLMKELIWGGYFKNDTIPQRKVEKVAQTIHKYLLLRDKITFGSRGKVFNQWQEWLLGVASAEIDQELTENFENEAWVEAMFNWFEERFDWADDLDEEAKKGLLYVAIHRALVKSDNAIIRFRLLTNFYPQWGEADDKAVSELAEKMFSFREKIESWLNHPLSLKLFRFLRKHTAPFWILRDIFSASEKPEEIISDQGKLISRVKEICQLRYSEIGQRVSTGIVRSIIYIFATKMVFAILIEVPYERIAFGGIRTLPLVINLLAPPLFMFLVGLLIKTPGEDNTRRIIERIMDFVYQQKTSERIVLNFLKEEGRGALTALFRIVYTAFFLAFLCGVSYGLVKLGFNVVSIVIFFFFLSLVVLFGFRVRWSANELVVVGEKEGLIGSLINMISLPLLDLGLLFSKGLTKLNALILILDFLIEAPLKVFLEVIGDWSNFIRRKQTEAVEVPI